MVRVIQADVELFLTGWLRRELAARPEEFCRGVKVSNREPEPAQVKADPFPGVTQSVPMFLGAESSGYFPDRLVVVRIDSPTRTSIITDNVAVGISVLAGTKDNPQVVNDLSRMVCALVKDCAAVEPGNPVAAVLDVNGPFPVDERQQVARRYMTVVLSCVGSAL